MGSGFIRACGSRSNAQCHSPSGSPLACSVPPEVQTRYKIIYHASLQAKFPIQKGSGFIGICGSGTSALCRSPSGLLPAYSAPPEVQTRYNIMQHASLKAELPIPMGSGFIWVCEMASRPQTIPVPNYQYMYLSALCVLPVYYGRWRLRELLG
jgi:hypothetical protein